MTCIVGTVDSGTVVIGGDSAGVSGWSLAVRADEKVFTREHCGVEWVFGFTTSFRMGQLIRWKLELPHVEDGDNLNEFMSTAFIDAVRSTLSDGGWLGKDKEQREEGGDFLVGVRGALFHVASDFQVGRAADPFMAVGCGADIALGAMFALDGKGKAEDRVRSALAASERFSAGVRGPYVVVSAKC